MYKTDMGGFTFKCSDVKIMNGASTWATRLSQLGRQKGKVRIITYSLPRIDYVTKQLQRRPFNIAIIAHSKYAHNQYVERVFLPLLDECVTINGC